MHWSRVAVVVCFAAANPSFVWAQQSVDYASVSGRVTDPQGGILAGAQVTARHTETNLTAETTTDTAGRFRFPHLKIGSYEVRIRLQGFADLSRHLTLTVGAAFDLPLTLTLASVDTNVTVSAAAVALEAARSQIAGTVPHSEILNLPMNGRNFLDLALLVPGVSPTNIGTTQLFAETSAVPGQGISIASQRNLSNNFIVDGVSANDDAAGLSGFPLSIDAVEQLQVVTSGAQAELGRALGGYISVVTRSGTNASRGGVYEFLRDDSLNAANPLLGRTLPMNQHQFGGSVGGPLRRDRTFYFSNIEQRLLDQSGLVTILPQNVPIINDRLTAIGYPGSQIATGVYPNPVHSTNVLGKIDHQFGGADQLSARYSLYRVTSNNSRGAGALSAFTASAGLDNVDHSIAVGNTWTISAKTVNETRLQVAYGDLEAPPTDGVGPAVSIAGVASFGTLSGAPTRRVNTMVQVVDNVSHQAGAHALRAGTDILFNADTITFPRSVRGSYAFSSLAAFLSGAYSGFTQTFGDPDVSQKNPNVGIYAQDEWRAGSNLTVNAGVRYDLQFLQTVRTDANNVSPRLGIVWSPSASRTLLVRGNAGLFFDRVPLRAVANAILSAGNTTDLTRLHQPSVSGLLPTQEGAPSFPNMLPARTLTTTLVDFTTMDRHLQNAYSRQASVEVERSAGRATVSLGYQYVRGDNLVLSVNQNVATCIATGANNGCRPEMAYRNNSQYSSPGESSYHGAHLSLTERATAWSSLRLSYTLSRSMNDVGEAFFSQPVDPGNIRRDWARSDDDQRHRFVAAGTINTSMAPAVTPWERVSHGFQLSGMVQWYSALPFNITSGVTSLQGTAGRPLANGAAATANFDVRSAALISRNAGTGGDFLSLNVRLNRTVRLTGGIKVEGIVEGFNLTNHVNALTRNANFGSGVYPTHPLATFNQVTAVADPRAFQIGIRVSF